MKRPTRSICLGTPRLRNVSFPTNGERPKKAASNANDSFGRYREDRDEEVNVICASAALLAACSGSALAAGDAAKGKEVFAQCTGCHMVGLGAVTLIGPKLNGVVGRKAASIANYPMYSQGMKTLGELGVVWTEANLDKWLANPKAILPDSYMSMFPGIPEASDRATVIAY